DRTPGSDVVGRLLVEEALEIGRAVAGRRLAPASVGVVRGLLVQRVVEDQRGLRLARLGFRGGAHTSQGTAMPAGGRGGGRRGSGSRPTGTARIRPTGTCPRPADRDGTHLATGRAPRRASPGVHRAAPPGACTTLSA